MTLSSILCAFKLKDHLGPLVVHEGSIDLINNSSKVILVYGHIALIKVHPNKGLHVHGIAWLMFIGSTHIHDFASSIWFNSSMLFHMVIYSSPFVHV